MGVSADGKGAKPTFSNLGISVVRRAAGASAEASSLDRFAAVSPNFRTRLWETCSQAEMLVTRALKSMWELFDAKDFGFIRGVGVRRECDGR